FFVDAVSLADNIVQFFPESESLYDGIGADGRQRMHIEVPVNKSRLAVCQQYLPQSMAVGRSLISDIESCDLGSPGRFYDGQEQDLPKTPAAQIGWFLRLFGQAIHHRTQLPDKPRGAPSRRPTDTFHLACRLLSSHSLHKCIVQIRDLRTQEVDLLMRGSIKIAAHDQGVQ